MAIAEAMTSPWNRGTTISEGRDNNPYLIPDFNLSINGVLALDMASESGRWWWVSSSKLLMTIPLKIPDTRAAKGLNNANTGPSIP